MTDAITPGQLAMFPGVWNTDPHTSHAAAAPVAIKAQGWARQVLDSLEHDGPATDDELCQRCNVPVRYWPSMKSARSRLHTRAGLVVWSGAIRDGQQVWMLAEREAVDVRVDGSCGL